jgi:hypothetical protein
MMEYINGTFDRMRIGRGNRKLAPVSLCPEIPHELTWD